MTQQLFKGDYDFSAKWHSGFQTFKDEDGTEELLDSFEAWGSVDKWHFGIKTRMINPCLRDGWTGSECTKKQKFVYENLQMYASSRPFGAPGFVCHFRRNTGSDKDKRPLKAGEVIAEWAKQILAASPPTVSGCMRDNTNGGLDVEENAIMGKCYKVLVPENSTYVVLESNFEMLFPTGCKFIVLEDEQSIAPGEPIPLRLDQTDVDRVPARFPGTFDPINVTDKEWYDGVLFLLAKASWISTRDTFRRGELVKKPRPYLRTPKGYIWKFFKGERANEENEISGDELKRIRTDFKGSTIYIPESMREAGTMDRVLVQEMKVFLQVYTGNERYKKLAWRASNGMLPTKYYNLKLEEWKPVESITVTVSGYAF